MFDFQCVSVSDIIQIIKGFDSKKAQGYDMVPMKLLQKSASYIAPDIAKMVNISIIKGIFLGDLKFSEVSSLFKKKDDLNKINYRPKFMKKPWVYRYQSISITFYHLYFRLFVKAIAVSQRFWTWLKISSVHSTGVNILHVLAWISARPLIVYLTI